MQSGKREDLGGVALTVLRCLAGRDLVRRRVAKSPKNPVGERASRRASRRARCVARLNETVLHRAGMTSKLNYATTLPKQLKPVFLKVSTNIDSKSNLVPSSVTFLLFLLELVSSIFFSAPKTSRASAVFQILDTLEKTNSEEGFRSSSGGADVSRRAVGRFVPLCVPQVNRGGQKNRPKVFGVFRRRGR